MDGVDRRLEGLQSALETHDGRILDTQQGLDALGAT